MANNDDWGGVAVNSQPQPDDWGGVPVEQPKSPDVSGVQKMAQDNLAKAANDNKSTDGTPKPPPTPMEHLSTATGLPVDKIVNGTAQPTDINAANRAQYVKALDNGSATDGSDWTQTMLHAIAPVTEAAFQKANPISAAAKPLANFMTGFSKAETEDLGFSQDTQDWLRKIGTYPQVGDKNLLRNMNEAVMNPLAASADALLRLPVALAEGVATAAEGTNTQLGYQLSKEARMAPNLMMEHGLGPTHPTALAEAVAAKLGKEPAAVTPSDINQVLADGSKNLHPPQEDFKTAAAATGIPEQGFKTVYTDAGVTPEKIVTDMQQNPAIAADVAAGKVPDQYQYLVEQKPALPTQQAEALHVMRDEATKSFNVVDRDGDHVQGGFDSYDEAKQHIEDRMFDAEERAAIEAEAKARPELTAEKTAAGEQTVIPGAEKISDKALAERKMEQPLQAKVEQKSDIGGMFDTDAQKQGDLLDEPIKEVEAPKWIKPGIIPPAETGKPTSLKAFIKNNGGLKDEGGDVASMGYKDLIRKGGMSIDDMAEIAQGHGYFLERPSEREFKQILEDTDGGVNHNRLVDMDRVNKAKENAQSKQMADPGYIEHEAANVGLDTERGLGETDKQYVKRLTDALVKFYSEQGGSVPVNLYRKMIGNSIIAVEKFAGKLGGNFFEQAAKSYKKTFQPEAFGDKAKVADSYLAKYKAAIQEAQNALFRRDAVEIRRVDRMTDDQRRQWLYDHETGRWNEEENPDHAMEQAFYDSMRKTEQENGVGTSNYKQNYLPHLYEKPDEVRAFFRSEPMIKKYGQDWFNKASEFRLVQEAEKAGFTLRTNNYVRMRIARQMASDNLVKTMDLLKDLENSGVATRATSFSVDKRIAKTQQAITDLGTKYKTELENIAKQNVMRDGEGRAIGEPTSKKMITVQARLHDLNTRMESLHQEKSDIKLTPEQLSELKTGFRIIGPDSKAWNIHQQAGPVWKNAMEMKGLWEKEGLLGDAYRGYMGVKAIYVRSKMFASLFHPAHETVIDISSSAASVAHHLIQGGKLSDLSARDIPGRLGLTKNTFSLKDHPKIQAWNTAPEARTPEQQADVKRMVEGGFVPTVSAENQVRVRENFDKAINGIGTQNLRLLGTAIEAAGLPMVPFMEHWIPGMKADSYFQRTDLALKRDPTLANDPAKRGVAFRQIAQDIERNYGEMNRNTLFWNPVVRDAFNATTFSGGWKLAMLQNMRGLAEPAKVAYKWAKTGEFSKEDITHQMLHSYLYTANNLMLGAAATYLFTGTVGIVKDWMNPPTGDKNPDGTPVRLQVPAFFKEPLMLLRDINQDGVVEGTGSFLYHQTLIPSISDSLLMRDFVHRPYITDPTDLQQWKNMGWDSISPITLSNEEKAEQVGSKTAARMGWAGFPVAGQWVNESPFEQKVTAKYYEHNPSQGSAYEAKLKAEMRGAVINHDAKAQGEIEDRMAKEGMSDRDIEKSEKEYTNKFSEFAWKKLSPADQRHIIESASPEEKENYPLKNAP